MKPARMAVTIPGIEAAFAGHCGGPTAQVSSARVVFFVCVYFGRVLFPADSCVRKASLHFCFLCQKSTSQRCEGSD